MNTITGANLKEANEQCQNDCQLNFDSLLTKNTNKVSSLSPLKNGHLQTGSFIFATDYMTGSV